MSIHRIPISMTEAPCSGQQAEHILLFPTEKRSECSRPSCAERRTGLVNTVGEREAKARLKELFDVWSPDILCLFNFHDAKNLHEV